MERKGAKGGDGGTERPTTQIILTYKCATNPTDKTASIDKEQVLHVANDLENSLRNELQQVSGVNSVEAIGVSIEDADETEPETEPELDNTLPEPE